MKRKMLLMICLLCLIWIPSGTIQAAVLKVKYHNTTYSYTGTQVCVSVDETDVDLDECPGLVIENTALVPMEEVFEMELGAETSFDSESGEIVISGFGNEILMYLDSTQAYWNGEKMTLPAAPLSVKYVKASETKILVPVRTVAEALGCYYTWNDSEKCAKITRPFQLFYDGTWTTYEDIQGTLVVNGTVVDLVSMPVIKLDDCLMVPAAEVFSVDDMNTWYQESDDTLQVQGEDVDITLTKDSLKAEINGEEKKLPAAPKWIKSNQQKETVCMVPIQFVAEQLGYSVVWEASETALNIFTSEEQMLNVQGYAFFEEASEKYAAYADSIPDMESSYTLEASGTNASISGIFYNGQILPYGERYILASDQPFGTVQASFDKTEKQIMLTCKDSVVIEETYFFDDSVIQSAAAVYDKSTNTSVITLQAVSDSIHYMISLSDDQCSVYVDIYKNCLTGMFAQTLGDQEILSFTGAMALEGSYTNEDQVLNIVFPYTMSGFDAGTFSNKSSRYIKKVSLQEQEDGSLLVCVSYQGNFYVQVSGTRSRFVFYGTTDSDDTVQENYDLYIPLPSGVTFADVTDKDPYADKKFKLCILGDYEDFYQQNTIVSNSDVISKLSVALNDAGTKTVITVRTTKIRGYRLYDLNGAVGVSLGSLRKMYQNIVLLDAGHGGKDSGAVNGSYTEKEFNLTILYKKMKQYFQSGTVKAFWTRANDTFIDLYERPKISSKAKADIFISLHMNSASSSSANGLEVYYSKNNKNKADSGLTSEKLAAFFQESLIEKIGCYDRGYKSAEYVVVKYNSVPAILIELGFITNSKDLSRLKNSQQQKKAAKAIYDTIVELFEQYPTGR